VNLIPLADRILIKPDEPPTMSESGLHLVDHWAIEQTGTVVAVGPRRHPRKDEAEDVAVAYEHHDPEIAQLLRDLTAKEPDVAVGDAVLFGRDTGQEITINDSERYLLLRHDDVLAKLEY
jgi:co-chaperonin GroES (HSP10)